MKSPTHLPALVLLLSSALLASGCAQLQKTGSINGQPSNMHTDTAPVSNQGQSLLEFASIFVELPEEAQKKQVAQFYQTLASNKGDLRNRMKLAMIYALPNSRLHDSARAQTLLDELLREKPQDSELKTLAILLRDHINENNKLIQKTREEQKRADAAQQKSDASQQKISDLERKLQDLKNIEKAMVDRDSGARK